MYVMRTTIAKFYSGATEGIEITTPPNSKFCCMRFAHTKLSQRLYFARPIMTKMTIPTMARKIHSKV